MPTLTRRRQQHARDLSSSMGPRGLISKIVSEIFGNHETPTQSPSQPAFPTPAASSAHANSGNDDDGNNGNGNGNSNGNGNGKGNNGNGNGNGNSGDSNTGNTSSSNTGNSGSSNTGNSSSSNTGSSNTGSNSGNANSGDGASNGGGGGGGTVTGTGSSSQSTAASDNSTNDDTVSPSKSTSHTTSSSSTKSTGTSLPLANAGAAATVSVSTGVNGASTAAMTGNPTSTTTPTPGNTAIIDSSATSKGGNSISTGAIAGIAIVLAIIVIVIGIFFFRRRYIKRRTQRTTEWWVNAGPRLGEGQNGNNDGDNASNRTFETTGFYPPSSSPTNDSLHTSTTHTHTPPMSEAHSVVPNTILPLFNPNSTTRDPPSLISFDNTSQAALTGHERHYSLHSVVSSMSESGGGAQYLFAPNGDEDHDYSTPMSVRPFSPSESFAFPRPPTDFSRDGSPVTVSRSLRDGSWDSRDRRYGD